MNRTILILSKFDSFARVAKRVADGFAAQGFIVDYRLISVGREALSHRVYREIGLSEKTPVTTMNALFQSRELAGFTAVYLGATGGFTRDFLGRMRTHFPDGTPRPLTIAGYPGVILREKLSGFANRCGCDFVLLNSSADLEDYCRFCSNYGLNANGARLLGYVFPPFRKEKNKKIQRVLFVEQAAIPSSLKERLYLVKQLALYASTHPEREVVIKPRLVPGEKSIFTTRYHIEYLLKSLPSLPANLHVDYSDIQKILEETDLCLTVSSSVALQSMWYGIPTGIIRDFGIRDEYGTDFFRGSGCLVSFDDLATDKFPVLHHEWFCKHFAVCDDVLPVLVEVVVEEYSKREQCGDWRNNGNMDAVFCEAYQRFRIGHNKKLNAIRTFLSIFWGHFAYQFKILFQTLKWRKGREYL